MRKGAGAAAGARGRSLLAAGKESNDTKQSEEESVFFFNGTFVRAHRYWELELKLYCLGSGAGPQEPGRKLDF